MHAILCLLELASLARSDNAKLDSVYCADWASLDAITAFIELNSLHSSNGSMKHPLNSTFPQPRLTHRAHCTGLTFENKY